MMTEFYSTQTEIDAWLQAQGVKNYTINADMSVDVEGHVFLSKKKLICIPVNFRNVSEFFNCDENLLTSLAGCPQSVGGVFDCSKNALTSLLYGPETVGGSYICEHNQLTSLQYIATKINHIKQIGYHFSTGVGCSHNQLVTLEHSPKYVNGSFECVNNRLSTLKGCPEVVNDYFIVSNNQLTSLEYCPKKVSALFFCHDNPLLGPVQGLRNFDEIYAVHLLHLEIARIKDEKNLLDLNIKDHILDVKKTSATSVKSVKSANKI